MKTIIAGSRSGATLPDVVTAIDKSGFVITEVVSGGSSGVDQFGEQWAARKGVPIQRFIPKWKEFGKAAGPMRNRDMAGYAEALVAIWDGQSKGTKSMIDEATKLGLKVFVHLIGNSDAKSAEENAVFMQNKAVKNEKDSK